MMVTLSCIMLQNGQKYTLKYAWPFYKLCMKGFYIAKKSKIKEFKGHQLTFTCLKSTTETLEKGVKYVQRCQKNPPERHL